MPIHDLIMGETFQTFGSPTIPLNAVEFIRHSVCRPPIKGRGQIVFDLLLYEIVRTDSRIEICTAQGATAFCHLHLKLV